jgi:hypothetical protein
LAGGISTDRGESRGEEGKIFTDRRKKKGESFLPELGGYLN